jgi:hypothetical protein
VLYLSYLTRSRKVKALSVGVDVGGVLIDRANDDTETSLFGDRYLEATPTPGAFAAVKKLVEATEGRVYLISKCGRAIREKTLAWLDQQDFWGKTGVKRENVFFVKQPFQKAPIATRLGITCFIDDKLSVLGCMDDVQNLILFQPTDGSKALLADTTREDDTRFVEWRARITMVESWEDVERLIS